MTETAARITETVEWQALQSHFAQVEGVHLRELFARDPRRGEAMTLEAADLYLDYSKNLITGVTLQLLPALAERAELRQRVDDMFMRGRINVTDDQPVPHVALRAPGAHSRPLDGTVLVPD